jgi:glycerophosphoryl diester phosphodiesterase
VILYKFFNIKNNSKLIQVPISWNGIKVVTKKFINRLHNDQLKIHVWTINREAEMQRLIDMGVDGIMTDNAIGLMKIMKKNKLN